MPTANSVHVFMGVFGEPGIGKTRLVGTSAQFGKTMIIRPPVDHTDSILPEHKPLIDERISRDWDDMFNLIDELRMEGSKYAWVWLDSISLWQDFGLDDLFESAVQRKKERALFGPDKGEFGINMFRIGAMFRHLVGPDTFNFGFTAHPAVLASPDLDDDGDPIEKLMPWVQGKNMSPKLCGYMNLVCFMERAGTNKKRVLRSQSDERYYAKDQFDAFGEKGLLWEPTMPKVMKAIAESPGRQAVARSKTPRPGARRTRTTTRK